MILKTSSTIQYFENSDLVNDFEICYSIEILKYRLIIKILKHCSTIKILKIPFQFVILIIMF